MPLALLGENSLPESCRVAFETRCFEMRTLETRQLWQH